MGQDSDDEWNPTDDDAPNAAPKKSGRTRRKTKTGTDLVSVGPGGDGQIPGLVRNGHGALKKNIQNVIAFMLHHPDWAGVLAFDEFAGVPVKMKRPPVSNGLGEPSLGEWTEIDSIRAAAWFQSEPIKLDVTPELVEYAMRVVSEERKFHVVRDYLNSLVWDRVPRVETWLATYCRAKDNEYTRAVGQRWLVSAVARVMDPGCKADCMLVLETTMQGVGKSTVLKVLGGDWYADTGITIGDKDSYQALRRVWIYEFAELASIKGREAERTKNFLSSTCDHYRPSYGRKYQDFPRQLVFAGTTNEREYMTDPTGERRKWPVLCRNEYFALDELVRDRDQIWAESLYLYLHGAKWHIDTPELRELCREEIESRMSFDDWAQTVAEWLKAPTVPDPYSQRARNIIELKEGITTGQALNGAVGVALGDIKDGLSSRMGKVLRSLELIPVPVRDGNRVCRKYYRLADAQAKWPLGIPGQ